MAHVAVLPQATSASTTGSAPPRRQLLHARSPHAAASGPQCHLNFAATTPGAASLASFHFSLQWPPPPSPSPVTSAPEPPLSIPCSAPSLPLICLCASSLVSMTVALGFKRILRR